MKALFKGFQKGTILTTGLETIPVTFSRMWLLFAIVLRICLKLNDSFEFITIAEEISKQPTIDLAAQLSVIILMQVF